MTPRTFPATLVLALAAGCSGTPAASPSVPASSPAPAVSTVAADKLIECTAIVRGYKAWTSGTNRMASLRQAKGERVAAEFIMRQALDATDEFGKTADNWPSQGAQLLHTAVLDFAAVLHLLNIEITLGGKGQFKDAALKEVEGKAVAVVLAYEAYAVGCPK